MKSEATHSFSVIQGDTCHSTFPNWLVFLFNTGLIQNPAQSNNFIIPAMASTCRVVFLILVCIRLPAHERASGILVDGPKVGVSQNSDSEN